MTYVRPGSVVFGVAVTALMLSMGCEVSSTASRDESTVGKPDVNVAEVPPTDARAMNAPDETSATDDAVTLSGATAMEQYREVQAMMKAGERNAAYRAAFDAMQSFIQEGNGLAWMMLESIPLETCRIDVHFNTGPRERSATKDGILRPMSFRVWANGDEIRMIERFDYEEGWINGTKSTAAFGRTDRSGHANLGMISTEATYDEIRASVIEMVTRRLESSDTSSASR